MKRARIDEIVTALEALGLEVIRVEDHGQADSHYACSHDEKHAYPGMKRIGLTVVDHVFEKITPEPGEVAP